MSTAAPAVKTETITPAKARKWLANANEGNRKLRPNKVSMYARDMVNDQWIFTGDPFRFNGDGKLIDGQHRLNAIIEANTPVQGIVIRNLDSAAKHCIDTGAKRTLSDVLHYEGFTHTAGLAAAIRWCMMYEQNLLGGGGVASGAPLSMADCLNWLAENGDIAISVSKIHSMSFPYGATRSALVGIRYYTSETAPGEADAFIERVVTGAGLSEGDPCLTFRKWLEWAYIRDGRMRGAREIQAITVKAWNAFIGGTQPRSFVYKPGGSKPEAFPTIALE